jgi:2,4-dienoyl-CoA reductase-like NADH-dependent reductase (Old Yellow Enzyme family)
VFLTVYTIVHVCQQTDAYGGSFENRFRFLKEILEAVLEVVPSSKVGVRLTPGGTFSDMADSNSLELFTYVIKQLDTYDLAYLHIKESDEQGKLHYSLCSSSSGDCRCSAALHMLVQQAQQQQHVHAQ